MPVEFLTEEQAASYGKFNEEPTRPELERFFFLDDEDRKPIGKRRGDHSRLEFALQMCTVLHRPVPPGRSTRRSVGRDRASGRTARHRGHLVREAVQRSASGTASAADRKVPVRNGDASRITPAGPISSRQRPTWSVWESLVAADGRGEVQRRQVVSGVALVAGR
jgi:hypothetical protein